MCVLFQSASWGKKIAAGRSRARIAAITATASPQWCGSCSRVFALIFSSPPGTVSTRSKPRYSHAACNAAQRPACRSFLLPCVTATFTTRTPASRSRRSANPPMMHSSSGCGEKTSALGASSGSGARTGVGNPPSGYCLPSRTRRAISVTRCRYGFMGVSGGKRREAGGRDGLAVTLVVFVRHVDLDPCSQLGELIPEHGASPIDDKVAAAARRDAAQNEDVLQIIEIGEVRDAVAEIRPERLVDLPRPVITLGHEGLDQLQLLRERGVGRRVDAGDRHQSCDALLRKILGAHAVISRPFVNGPAGVQIDRHERELVEPRGDVSLG